jgi:hypothetical protein
MTTGARTQIGSMTPTTAPPAALAYGMSTHDSGLYAIDTTTGAAGRLPGYACRVSIRCEPLGPVGSEHPDAAAGAHPAEVGVA